MKRLISFGAYTVFLLLSFFFTPFVNAQVSAELITQGCGHEHDNVIVRMSKDNVSQMDYVVSYQKAPHVNFDERQFMWLDATLSPKVFDLSLDSIHVEDFQILKEVVYFCGNYNGEAIFGSFQVSDFQTGTINLNCFTDTNAKIFTKMKMYIDPTTLHPYAALVGYSSANSYIYIVDATSGNANYYFPDPYSSIFSIEDVAVTNDYIVAVGRKDSYSKAYLYRIDKSNYNTCYYSEITSTDYMSFNSAMVIESLGGNDIAFAALHINISTGNHYMNVYTYDMQNYLCMNVQAVPVIEKCNPKDLLYMPFDNSLLLLLDNDYPSYNQQSSIVYYLDPYNNNYMADLFYDQNNEMFSLDRFTNPTDTRFMVGCETSVWNHRLFFHDKSSLTTTQCIKFDNVFIEEKRIPTNNVGIPSNDTEQGSKVVKLIHTDVTIIQQGCVN